MGGYAPAMLSRSPSPSGFIEPCLPTLAREVPGGPLWVHEIKHDGFRFICRLDGDRVRVFSRNGRDWTERVPLIAEALLALPVSSATVDGEGVVCDERGLSDFDRLRSTVGRRGSREAFLYAFDLLELDGQDLRARPWDDRRVALVRLLRKSRGGLRLSEHLDGGDGATIFEQACHLGLEGSSPSAAIGPIARGDRPIGSRSGTRTRPRRRASWSGEARHQFGRHLQALDVGRKIDCLATKAIYANIGLQ